MTIPIDPDLSTVQLARESNARLEEYAPTASMGADNLQALLPLLQVAQQEGEKKAHRKYRAGGEVVDLLGGNGKIQGHQTVFAADASRVLGKRRRLKADVEDSVAESEPLPEPEAESEPEVDAEAVTDKEKELREAGPLSKTEWEMIDAAVVRFKEDNALGDEPFNEYIQSTNRAPSAVVRAMWSTLYDALPHRQHVAVMRACRRRFNNFTARGKWQTEDDEALRKAYTENPGSWVRIGQTLGRMAEDCRDRWRNYLSCGDQRRVDDWTEKEEVELSLAVQQCIDAGRQEAKEKAKAEGHAFREQDVENYINFNAVSQKMNRTRSRLQCYTHWRVMQNRDPNLPGKTTSRREGVPNRQERALSNFKKMSATDKYSIVKQIAESSAREESEIRWKQLAREDPNKRWSMRDRKEAFAKMKQDLAPDVEDFASVMNKLLDHFVFEEIQPTETEPSPQSSSPVKQKRGKRGPYMTKKRRAALEQAQGADEAQAAESLGELSKGEEARSVAVASAALQQAELDKTRRKNPDYADPESAHTVDLPYAKRRK